MNGLGVFMEGLLNALEENRHKEIGLWSGGDSAVRQAGLGRWPEPEDRGNREVCKRRC